MFIIQADSLHLLLNIYAFLYALTGLHNGVYIDFHKRLHMRNL